MSGNSLKPLKINGKTKVASGGIAVSALVYLGYMMLQNTAAIEQVDTKRAATTSDVAELKKDVRHIRESVVLICAKMDISECRRR